MDLEHPAAWRTAQHLSTIADLVQAWRKCNCYEYLMKVEIKNLTIDSSGYDLPVRIYYPKSKEMRPILIFFHGGGFMYNNSDVYDQVNRYFAAYGDFIVISPDYRLAPENKFPVGINDCYETLEWADENKKELNGSDIFIAGDSAGGNITALSNLPPACFVSAECDPLPDQALMYAARLEDEGVEVEFNLYTGVLHAFINRPMRKSIEAMDTIIKFVQAHIK